MKRAVYFLVAMGSLLFAASCTPENSAADNDKLYEQGTDKEDYVPPPNG